MSNVPEAAYELRNWLWHQCHRPSPEGGNWRLRMSAEPEHLAAARVLAHLGVVDVEADYGHTIIVTYKRSEG